MRMIGCRLGLITVLDRWRIHHLYSQPSMSLIVFTRATYQGKMWYVTASYNGLSYSAPAVEQLQCSFHDMWKW